MIEKLWAECAMISILLDRILSNKVREKCKWERFYKRMPKFVEKKIRIFGEVGVV